ncbi:MAG: S41 family peptidase, partial [Bacteroidota bacterium]
FRFTFVITCLLLLLFNSCGRLIVGENPENTASTNFDYFIDAVRENYSFFTEKQVSWDSLVRVYRPLVNDQMGNDSLYQVFAKMLFTLEDGHVNFYTDFDRSRNHGFVYNYPNNYNNDLIRRNYLGTQFSTSGGFTHTWLRDSVGYVKYSSFRSSFTGRQLNHVLNRYAAGQGLILDLRDNGGGSMNRMYTIVSCFLEAPTFIGTMQYKNGPGPNDFSALDSFHLKPRVNYVKRAEAKAKAQAKQAKKKKKTAAPPVAKTDSTETIRPKRRANRWAVPDTTGSWQQKPIVVLVGRQTYSAANFTAAFLSTLPHVTLIGDRTGGGGGVPVSFELPNGWKFRLSATRTYLPDGTDIEMGIEPDIYQATGYEEALEGKDAILERALTFLAKK